MFVKQVFFDLGARIHADEARALVAKLLDDTQPGLVSALMNYMPNSKTSKTEFPLVQFSNFGQGFAMLGFGDFGAQILSDATPIIHDAMAKLFASRGQEVVVKVSSREVPLSCEKRPYAMQYTVAKMVVQKKHEHRERLANPETGKVFLEGLFMRSLERQAAAVGMVLPKDLVVSFKGAERVSSVKLRPDSSLAHGSLRNAIFEVNARLGGIWSVGFLLSKGYGHFNADMLLGTGGAINALSK
ncbi:hypothetical protein IPC1135_29850 [Pseudomonas aeruginosa]|uniref:hypothetical protein n=1 Tax=Pseudomonas aeruginosa TaxID=287 RepID=UPI000FC3F582|nr:hypothetical protein [Pseudomonas aeruginosa]RUE86372.1 hypothetical protein IPC1135_29850 [Pseudomonas aeruginosa]